MSLSLNNHIDLGPNCPDEDIACPDCDQFETCPNALDVWDAGHEPT